MSTWSLKRTKQCAKCPWKKKTDPETIPNGYSRAKHEGLSSTIAGEDGNLSSLGTGSIRIMACHETHSAHCVGWLNNQLGVGNNIPLRLSMLGCSNMDEMQTFGEQCESFEETLTDRKEG